MPWLQAAHLLTEKRLNEITVELGLVWNIYKANIECVYEGGINCTLCILHRRTRYPLNNYNTKWKLTVLFWAANEDESCSEFPALVRVSSPRTKRKWESRKINLRRIIRRERMKVQESFRQNFSCRTNYFRSIQVFDFLNRKINYINDGATHALKMSSFLTGKSVLWWVQTQSLIPCRLI